MVWVHDRTSATGLVELSIELAELGAAVPAAPARRLALAPAGSSDAVGLVNLGVPLVFHPVDQLGPIESWIQEHSLRYGELETVYHTQGPGQLTTAEYWKLQGAANGFRVDQLQGCGRAGSPRHPSAGGRAAPGPGPDRRCLRLGQRLAPQLLDRPGPDPPPMRCTP